MNDDEHGATGGALLRVGLATAALLAIPALAMRFTTEVRWGPGDFVAAAALLAGAGFAWVVAARRIPRGRRRTAAGLALLAALLLVWAELAVGLLPD